MSLFRKPAIIAEIVIQGLSDYPVTFTANRRVSERDLQFLCLLYACKVRHAIGDNNEHVGQFYGAALSGSIDGLVKISERTSELIEEIQDDLLSHEGSVTYGDKQERFEIRYFDERRIGVKTSIPLRGYSANLPLSLLILLQTVDKDLDDESSERFRLALVELHHVMFELRISNLRELYKAAISLDREYFER